MEDIIQNAVKLVKAVDAKMAVPPVWEITGLTGRWYFRTGNLLEHWDVPMGVKTAEHAPSTFRRKEFSFES